ncbi:UDP-N-acetylglucosamine 2-epimerase [Sphingorhabdus contaminans]|uniref:UDP-N-acetylglucosamine 2-epimerase (Hydrolyzing) n=1 Tax=Sphingorhabdus contaminans TaxID=1343899 RepID=A0A553WBI1_9SPHN|nr:UDP-N-acetylglucosamine 2-epimerase [Sphingorhabdus contaminans]TSB02044.1 UDP-N-acetylglucosamine 2-epimerase (hydrolyzing) [Sphingorhabdus contaminans]
MMRKICVVTGSRAEFGLLQNLMHDIKQASDLNLQVIATGMHLSPKYGLTYREIEAADFIIDSKIDMLLSSDSASAVTKSVGLGTIGFADAYAALKPDILVLLGDRFEMLAAATAALIAGIPIAHLHGGEITEGAFDDAIRHALTKMSHLHFVANSEYRQRVIQLGEEPHRVFDVGGLGVDAIKRLTLLDKKTLEDSLSFRFAEQNLLVTFHPVTLAQENSVAQMTALLRALDAFPDAGLIFTLPNADNGNDELIGLIEDYVSNRWNAQAYTSLGQLRYLSCMQFVDGVVGNSSSGIAEAPSLKIGTVNIGERQQGRLMAQSVISCDGEYSNILAALYKLFDPQFRKSLAHIKNPYGDGGATERIVKILASYPLEAILKKPFYDIQTSG